MTIGDILAIACLVFGFGFVVFFHELGHFLAAKWVGIKVEQFAVGFGHAVFAWRKGMGWRVGSTAAEYERRLREHIGGKQEGEAGGEGNSELGTAEMSRAGEELGLGDTEYRLNWVPLGGYVKMLGQDDMNPNAQAEDPRAYNKKSVGARMLVVSAGVIMNVILAAILFMVVFLIGFRVAPPIIGNIETGSPAQKAGLQVGDRVLYLNGQYQHDFTKLFLNTALAPAGHAIPMVVERGGKEVELTVKPEPAAMASGAVLSLGAGQGAISELRGPDEKLLGKLKKADDSDLDPRREILPGDVITAINGVGVGNPKTDYPMLEEAIQASEGKPIELTVRGADNQVRRVEMEVYFQRFFGGAPVNFAGMQPRPTIEGVMPKSPVTGKLRKGDIVTEVRVNGERLENPGMGRFVKEVNKAGSEGRKVGFVVEREGKLETVEETLPDYRNEGGKRGVGVAIGLDAAHPVVSEVMEGSAAARAKIPGGAVIVKVNGQEVRNWFDVHRLLKRAGASCTITYWVMQEGKRVGQSAVEAAVHLSEEDRALLGGIRYAHGLVLRDRIDPRQTRNPLTAAAWGVTETRDLLLQFYVTLRRLYQGSVGASNLMGPIGIMHTGSMFAFKGWDWLIWFLAMISANLAVVNFLPIPVVDGGLFVFLIIEKLVGRPLSPRMQTAAQIVGLALILSVFLLVTYQDIARFWM